MKKTIILGLAILLILALAACGQTTSSETAQTTIASDAPLPAELPASEPIETEEPTEAPAAEQETIETVNPGTNVLVAYFTYSENIGDTSGMTADAITSASLDDEPTDNTDGNLHVMALKAAEYTGGDLFSIVITDPYDPHYRTMVGVAQEDQNNDKSFSFVDSIEDFERYDVIYLGVPVWWGKLPQPLVSFFEEYDFSEKTIVPFGIHLGSRFGNMLGQISELAPGAELLDGFTIRADASNDEVREEFTTFLDGIE